MAANQATSRCPFHDHANVNSFPSFADDSQSTQELPDEGVKLKMLRYYDSAHTWTSLDDERVCVLCGHEFSGREVEVIEEDEQPLCKCPTPGCAGDYRHFVLPGNPLLDDTSWSDWMSALGDDEGTGT